MRIQEELSLLYNALRAESTRVQIFMQIRFGPQNVWCARIIYQKHTNSMRTHNACYVRSVYRGVCINVHAGMGEDNIQ